MKTKKIITVVIVTIFIFVSFFSMPCSTAKASKDVTFSSKSRVNVGDTLTIKIKNASKNVKYSLSNKKAKIIYKTNKMVIVEGRKEGKVKLFAKQDGEKYTYNISVYDGSKTKVSAHAKLNGIYCKATYYYNLKKLKLHFVNNSEQSVILCSSWADDLAVTVETTKMKKGYIVDDFAQEDFMNFTDLKPDVDSTIILKTPTLKGSIVSVKINGILYLDDDEIPIHTREGYLKDIMYIDF